jgi:YgiT-type zinc finger domain-containing protein
MDCVICRRGEREPGLVTQSFHKGNTVILVKDIPAEVCDTCGEPYFSSDVVRIIEKLMEDAVRKGVEVEVVRYAA